MEHKRMYTGWLELTRNGELETGEVSIFGYTVEELVNDAIKTVSYRLVNDGSSDSLVFKVKDVKNICAVCNGIGKVDCKTCHGKG